MFNVEGEEFCIGVEMVQLRKSLVVVMSAVKVLASCG